MYHAAFVAVKVENTVVTIFCLVVERIPALFLKSHDLAEGMPLGFVPIKPALVVIDIKQGSTALGCLLYTSPSPRDYAASRMPSSA